MRSAWQEFTIAELKALRDSLGDSSREGYLDAVGEGLLVEISDALDRRAAALPPPDATDDTDTPADPKWLS